MHVSNVLVILWKRVQRRWKPCVLFFESVPVGWNRHLHITVLARAQEPYPNPRVISWNDGFEMTCAPAVIFFSLASW